MCLWQVARLAEQAQRLQGQLQDFLPSEVPLPQPMQGQHQAALPQAALTHPKLDGNPDLKHLTT